jgi:uncharacterized protein (DUF3084 family)
VVAKKRRETPLSKLGRVLGGVVLMQGRLGHQVLGEMMVTNLNQSELAGATLVVAANSRRRNVFAQAAIGTAAPAVAVQALVDQQDKILTARETQVTAREKQVDAREKQVTARETQVTARETQVTAREKQVETR